MQMIQQSIFGGSKRPTPAGTSGNISVIKDPSGKQPTEDKEVASVVVTVCSSGSYDQLFRKLPQESEYGRVAVYLVNPGSILKDIQNALDGTSVAELTCSDTQKEIIKQLVKDCEEAGADAVCFNFECCGGYSSSGFGSGQTHYHMNLVTFLVKEFGCMTMFSDFSLKALINDWNKALGPNPFIKTGEFSGDLHLGFDPEQLKKSPSAQLNTVGSLSEGGKAKLHAMGGTIKYSISKNAKKLATKTKNRIEAEELKKVHPLEKDYSGPYDVEVLTVATNLTGSNGVTIGNDRGMAGHVLLTFPPSQRNIEKFKADIVEEEAAKEQARKEGKAVIEDEIDTQLIRGMILSSCGHWIELMKIDVNMNRLLNTVQNEWGNDAAKYNEMNSRYAAMDAVEQERSAQAEAVSYLQSKAPAKFNQKLMRKRKKGY